MRRLAYVSVLGLLIGCGDNSSDKPAVLPTPSAPAATGAPGANGATAANGATVVTGNPAAGDAGISWNLPAGWTQREGSQMRIATLTSDAGVEVSVTGFAGQAGGLVMNVNRWRGQVELPPLSEADIASSAQKVPTASGEATLVDMASAGNDPQRIVAAIIPGPGKTFFFKIGKGPAKPIEDAKPGFLTLLKTVKTDAAAQ